MKPEAKIKELVKLFFKEKKIVAAGKVEKGVGWYYMPVQSQYGTTGIPDFVGHYRGHFFSVETKAPGKHPTGLQLLIGENIRDTGAEWFVVDGEISLRDVAAWMEIIDEAYKRSPGIPA